MPPIDLLPKGAKFCHHSDISWWRVYAVAPYCGCILIPQHLVSQSVISPHKGIRPLGFSLQKDDDVYRCSIPSLWAYHSLSPSQQLKKWQHVIDCCMPWRCIRNTIMDLAGNVGDMSATWKKVAKFEQTYLFWPTRNMLLSTFLCRGKFVHRYVHPVPTYVFLYVKNRLSPFLTTFTQQQSIAGATSPLVALRSLAIITLPSPHSSLPTPVSPLSFPLSSPLHLVWFVVMLSHRPGVSPRCAALSWLVSSSCRVSYHRFAASSPLAAPALFSWL